jgi:hypothetical protein
MHVQLADLSPCRLAAFLVVCVVCSCSAVIGEVDEEVYDSLDLDSIRAAPLRAVGH